MMPTWGGWLMLFMGIVVGWIIGHQLGVQWEARRVQRSVELVLHPPPRDWEWEGMLEAAEMFAGSYEAFSQMDGLKPYSVSRGPDTIDGDFVDSIRYYALTAAARNGLLTVEGMPGGACGEIEDFVELEESHLEDIARDVACYLRSAQRSS